jgi:hypothetical protein
VNDDGSELRRGLRSLGRAVGTVAGRVLGERVVGQSVPPERVAVSPEFDAGVMRAAEDLARLLHAAGKGLEQHPLDPVRAAHVARAHVEDPLDRPEGLGPLAVGLRDLGGGLARVAEGLLDEVAPRRPAEAASAAPSEAPQDPTTAATGENDASR